MTPDKISDAVLVRRALRRLRGKVHLLLALRRAYALLEVYRAETHPHLYRRPEHGEPVRPWEWEELC